MKILYLIRDPYPTARPDVLTLFGEQLPQRGFEVDVVALRRPDVTGLSTRWPSGSEITANGRVSGLLRPMIGLWLDLKALAGWRRYDGVVVRDKIVTAALALLIVPKQRVFYWMSFPFPQEDLERAKAAPRGRLHAAALRLLGSVTQFLLDRWIVPRAARVFVQSARMAAVVAERSGRAGGLVPVPMGVDERRLQQPRALRTRADGAPFVLAYLGLVDRVRRVDFLLEVMRWLREHGNQDYRLLVVGDASTRAEYDWLVGEAARMGLADVVTFTGRLSMADAWQRLDTAHLGLSAIPRGELFDVSSPTKAIEYLAMGLPVVVNDIPEQEFLVRSTGGGRCVPMQVEAFGRAIEEVADGYAPYARRALDSRRWILEQRAYGPLSDGVARALRDAVTVLAG